MHKQPKPKSYSTTLKTSVRESLYTLQKYDAKLVSLLQNDVQWLHANYICKIMVEPWKMHLLQSYLVAKKRHPARIWTWVLWMLVRCSYQLSHWRSEIEAEDRLYISINTVQFSGWISFGLFFFATMVEPCNHCFFSLSAIRVTTLWLKQQILTLWSLFLKV